MQNSQEESNNNYSATLNYKETQYEHKEIQNDYRETEIDENN